VRRLPLLLAAVAALVALGVLSSVATQGFRVLGDAEAERDRLLAERTRLESEIERLETTVEALRTDPEAVETLARRELGFVRPGERVLLLATPVPPPPPSSLTVASPTPILTLRD